MTLVRPTLSEVIERLRADIESRLPGADSRLRHSLLDALVRADAGAIAGLYGYLDFIADQLIYDTATGDYLARWAAIWGVNRKAAVAAAGTATFTGDNDITIPLGAELSRIDGTLYRTTAAGTIAAGTASIALEAVEGGIGGNAIAGTQLTLTSPVAGVQSVAVVAGGGLIGGAAEEDDDSLRARFLQRIRTPPQGGSKSDYEQWVLQVAEVTRVWVYPAWTGLGTVGIAFVLDGREDIIPTAGDIEAVEEHLDPLRPVTATPVVFAPSELEVDLQIRLAPDDAPTRAAVEAELADLFTRDATPGGTIYHSRISEAISLAAGEHHHVLELPDYDITTAPGEMAFLRDVTWV